MIIIPPKLKILAGFKPDEDVTWDQIIAALEKMKPGIPATEINNVRERQAKFQRLLNEREQALPNESYETRFKEVVNSAEGAQLWDQMHQPEIAENFGNSTAISNVRERQA